MTGLRSFRLWCSGRQWGFLAWTKVAAPQALPQALPLEQARVLVLVALWSIVEW